MKKVILLILFILICFNLFAQKKLTLSAIRGQVLSDISKAVLKEAYLRIGYEVEFIHYPPKRSLIEVNQGRVDGEVHRIQGMDEDFFNLIMIKHPINYVEITFFYTDKSLNLNDWNDLKELRIGIKRGIFIVEKNTRSFNREIVDDDKQLFLLLQNHRIDVIAMDKLNGLENIAQLNLEDVLLADPSDNKVYLYHYLHNQHKYLIPLITESIGVLTQKGFIEQVRKKFMN
ncbi:MAG: transporter substrate-binding domain-containing protein [Spirochaetes bacterium]|nr:transporter substrate-binding domain-containing protein [Spirochaetota bacterium]